MSRWWPKFVSESWDSKKEQLYEGIKKKKKLNGKKEKDSPGKNEEKIV